MKIFVTTERDSKDGLEMEVDEYSQGENIKYYFNEIHQEDQTWTKDYYRLIYKNIIINDHDFIRKYKISDGDKIWHGKIENYLESDDVIVELFLAGTIPNWVWLIIKLYDSIDSIRSIIERFQPEIIHIWNSKGDQMIGNQSITDINEDGYYRLIVRCADEKVQNFTFTDCCDQHDKFRLKFCYFRFDLDFDLTFSSTFITDMKIIINKVRQIILSNNKIDDILNKNLSDFPHSYANSKFLFCIHICERIWDICEEYWGLIQDEDNLHEWGKMRSYFCLSLLDCLHRYSLLRSDHIENGNRSYNEILIDAMDHVFAILSIHDDSWKRSIKLLMNSFLLLFRSDSQLDDWLGSYDHHRSAVIVIINGETHELKVQTNPQNISESKLEIARNCGVDIQDLYCIHLEDNIQPNDEDPFQDGGIIFEIMKRIESFDVGKEIARGGFGIVFLCQERISGKQFIIKKSIDKKSSFYRDIYISNHLNGVDKLVSGLDIVRDHKEESIFLAMQYMPRGSLTEYIEQCIKQWKGIQEKAVVKISYQILTQINEIHQCKVIHCDIKPDNIVFDGKGNAKLIDYGLAKYLKGMERKDESRKRKASSPGTIYYLAPEIFSGELYSYKSDIWSFGMVLVEMVTGKPPFHWAGIGRVVLELKKMKKFKFKPIKPISKELNEFINSCLTVNPNERPTGEDLMRSELFIHSFYK